MIKNKKINSVVAVVSACSLMAGFTSEAAGSQPEGRVLAVSNENNIVELQRDTFYVMPDTPVVSAKSKIEEEQKKIIEEIKRKEREAKEKAEREAAALRNRYQ